MKLSQLVKDLQEMLDIHGDMIVLGDEGGKGDLSSSISTKDIYSGNYTLTVAPVQAYAKRIQFILKELPKKDKFLLINVDF